MTSADLSPGTHGMRTPPATPPPATARHGRPAAVHRTRGRRAAATLALLTTLCTALTFTAVAVPAVWLLLPLLLMAYGAGTLLVREAAVRVGAGWPSLVLLAVAYQLAVDGLGLQALTSPELYDAADWGLRSLGVNWTYWEAQIGVHVVLSVLLPVMIADLLFPDLRNRPYLRGGGVVTAGALTVLGVIGLRVFVSAAEDPGYLTPWGWTVAYVLAVAGLTWVALRVLPRRRRREVVRQDRRAPHPMVVGFVSLYLTMAFLTTLLPLGLGDELMLVDAMSQEFMLIAGAMTAIPFGWVAHRWRLSGNWTDTHRLWLVGGILVSHTAFMMPGSLLSAAIGLITICLELLALRALARHLRKRTAAPVH
ncbi:hypothetical protein MTQ01_08255 [Streptomyces sp. XM4193]|uniref:hypothetical protein n=1 Tax=Streptomyces sp. XM4193 TaxID=2929782 RepID=UPI001FFBD4AE|nr:hypothetical protein [Streptomyces sp. XM4193]MCK1795996.1 hypothetical protein [Streptomyces sp. XM4193]